MASVAKEHTARRQRGFTFNVSVKEATVDATSTDLRGSSVGSTASVPRRQGMFQGQKAAFAPVFSRRSIVQAGGRLTTARKGLQPAPTLSYSVIVYEIPVYQSCRPRPPNFGSRGFRACWRVGEIGNPPSPPLTAVSESGRSAEMICGRIQRDVDLGRSDRLSAVEGWRGGGGGVWW